MSIDNAACARYWQTYLRQLPATHPHRAQTPDAFAFGGGGEVADTLADLVLAGSKRATTSLAVEFTSLGEPLPAAGSLSIILRGDLSPVAIIERTGVTTVPFEEVDAAYAAIEGEGDAGLDYWRAAHRRYFAGVCQRLGGQFDDRTPVICQVFRLVWPPQGVRLYQAATSSASWRLRIALALKGIAFDAVWIDLEKNDNLAADYTRIVPTRQVPCLEIDGRRLFQSVAIIEYLEETRPEPALLPRAPEARAQVRAIVELVNSGIQPLHNLAVRRRLASQFGANDAAANDWCRYWIERQLVSLEQLLGATHDRFAFGDAATLADVFLYPQVSTAARFGVEPADFPVLGKLVANLAALPAFRDSHPPAP